MARPRIGQERLGFSENNGAGAALDQIAGLIDWSDIDRQLAGIYAAPEGEHALAAAGAVCAMLLAIWHDLSDVALAEAVADRACFRRSAV